MKLYSPKVIDNIKKEYNFHLAKNLGQNFLTDKNIIDKIIEKSEISETDLIIEIGPGVGVITRELAMTAGYVIAIEIDKRLVPILDKTLEDLNNVEIINEDVLKVDINQIINDTKKKLDIPIDRVKIVGNLPYYITTPIVMKILEEKAKIDSITIMMQKEVADRIQADEKSKERGAISVAVQYYCTVKSIVNVPKDVFVPKPKVDSTVLKLDVREKPPVFLKDDKIFFQTIKSGFGQRRKTLYNSLSSGMGISKEVIGEILDTLKIDRNRRAETLNINEFGEIGNLIYEYLHKEKSIGET